MGETLEQPNASPTERQYAPTELDALAEQANKEAREELNDLLSRTEPDPDLDIEAARTRLAELGQNDQDTVDPDTMSETALDSEQSTEPESDPNRAAETRRIIALIDQRKGLRHQGDNLRIQALQLALDYGLMDEFPSLQPWEADGLKQGLIHQPSSVKTFTAPADREAITAQIQVQLDEANSCEQRADALTAEIKQGVKR
jgi:hypothetical protein